MTLRNKLFGFNDRLLSIFMIGDVDVVVKSSSTFIDSDQKV